eukprot:2410586-Pleurochrysis_carterae.AAC.1
MTIKQRQYRESAPCYEGAAQTAIEGEEGGAGGNKKRRQAIRVAELSASIGGGVFERDGWTAKQRANHSTKERRRYGRGKRRTT